MSIEERLARIEAQNRCLRLSVGALCFIAASTVLLGAGKETNVAATKVNTNVVEAQGFAVKNANGQLMASLGMDGDKAGLPRLAIYDSKGNARAEVRFDETEQKSVLALSAASDFTGPRAAWVVDDSNRPTRGINFLMGLPGPQGALLQTLVSGDGPTERIVTYLAAEGNLTPANKSMVLLQIEKKGPTVKLIDSNGNVVFTKP
jgi:hypothetical protein